jgi:hypothetical protein
MVQVQCKKVPVVNQRRRMKMMTTNEIAMTVVAKYTFCLYPNHLLPIHCRLIKETSQKSSFNFLVICTISPLRLDPPLLRPPFASLSQIAIKIISTAK